MEIIADQSVHSNDKDFKIALDLWLDAVEIGKTRRNSKSLAFQVRYISGPAMAKGRLCTRFTTLVAWRPYLACTHW